MSYKRGHPYSSVRGPRIPKIPPPKCSVRELFTLLGHFLKMFEKMSISFLTMLPYRFQYNESESEIKNYNLFYKKPKKPKYFRNLEKYIDCLPPKTDTHRRFRTRNRILEPVRIILFFCKKYVIFYYIYIYKYIYIHIQKICLLICIFINLLVY